MNSNSKEKQKSSKKVDTIPINHKTNDLPPLPKDNKKITYKKLPKNVNQYRHIINTYYTRETDVEWMLELRHYNPIDHTEKNTSGSGPDFYTEDLLKYKKKVNLKDNRNLKTNMGNSSHLYDHPAGQPPNSSQISYETYLRTEDDIRKHKSINIIPWNSTSFSPKTNIFDTYLPPVMKISKDNLERLDKMVSRPLIQINKEGIVDGIKVKQRTFEPSPLQTLRYPSEHCPSSKYNNHFKIKNLNMIKHVMNEDNINATTQWGGMLRYYNSKGDKTDGKIKIRLK